MIHRTDTEEITCRHLLIHGIVQGVGFRPFVFRLATRLQIRGWVRNSGSGVEAVLHGPAGRIDELLDLLYREKPPLARIDRIDQKTLPGQDFADFRILETSRQDAVHTSIGPDSATCPDCLAEIFDPANRRWRYAFINCTHCGPRYTLTHGLPYDRANTSMAGFSQCPDCLQEYRDPLDRRFHAEPNACSVCGPALRLRIASPDKTNGTIPGNLPDDPIAAALALLLAGHIVAIKSLGGFHLACDARNAQAVARLRERKHRDEKPFALMVLNPSSARRLASIGEQHIRLLISSERPIVLAEKNEQAEQLFPGIAPGLSTFGLMLPYTPVHYLLFHEFAGRPAGIGWLEQVPVPTPVPAPTDGRDLCLVMTSANPGGEPLVTGDDEAIERLAGIADAFLLHDRAIVCRCDDSLLKILPGQNEEGEESKKEEEGIPQFIRRARGYTPRAIRLSASLAKKNVLVMAVGAYFNNTLCLTRGGEAFLSPHIGDLSNAATCIALRENAEHLQRLLWVEPEIIAHDLHPDFYSTHLAIELAEKTGCRLIGVQHHHAHIAAVLAEHRCDEPVIGLALDGVGLGSDGSAWGGELLHVDGACMTRIGHLAPLALPGGDKAAQEPWRMAAAILHQLGQNEAIAGRFPHQPGAALVQQMLTGKVNTPFNSSLGRYFDAAAGLLGICDKAAYEGHAPMLLETLASRHHKTETQTEIQPDGWRIDEALQLDLLPLFSRLAELNPADPAQQLYGAALFHGTLGAALADWTTQVARHRNLNIIAFGGGCFLNSLLSVDLDKRLKQQGFKTLAASQIPPGDGGISLGQAWVALRTCS